MFRCRQKFHSAPFCSMLEFEPVTDERNHVRNKLINLSEVELPEPAAYDLGLLIEAGIPLQKVNTKVLTGDLQAGLEVLDNLEQKNNEVNDEQQ